VSKKLRNLRSDPSRMTVNIRMKLKSVGREKAQDNQEMDMKEVVQGSR
jgi:hypothetical protein